MAIAIASSVADYVTATSDEDIALGVPTDTAEGDLLIIVLSHYGRTPSTPSGWDKIVDGTYLKVYKRAAGASEGTTTIAMGGTYNYGHAIKLRITGANAAATLDTATESVRADYDTTLSFPNISVTTAGSMILWFGQTYDGDNTRSISAASRGTYPLYYGVSSLAAANSLGLTYESGVSSGTATGGTWTMSSDVARKVGNGIAIPPAATASAGGIMLTSDHFNGGVAL